MPNFSIIKDKLYHVMHDIQEEMTQLLVLKSHQELLF